MIPFKTHELTNAFEAQDAQAFAKAAFALCPPTVTRTGASGNRITVSYGLQVQVQLLSVFREMDGGDTLRDGVTNSRMVSAAKTMTWSWSQLVRTIPTAQNFWDAVTITGTHHSDGVYRTPDGYIVVSGGIQSLPVDLADVDGLQYKDGGRFISWLESLDFEEIPA